MTQAKLFLGGLSFFITQADLNNYFSQFGELKEVKLVIDKITKKSKCYGFVIFERKSSLRRVLASQPHELKGRVVDCQIAKGKVEKNNFEEEINDKKLFVGGLPKQTTNQDLQNYFSQFGYLEKAYVILDYSGQYCRGYGYVIFELVETRDEVVSIKWHLINGSRAFCSKFKAKEDWKARQPFERFSKIEQKSFYKVNGQKMQNPKNAAEREKNKNKMGKYEGKKQTKIVQNLQTAKKRVTIPKKKNSKNLPPRPINSPEHRESSFQNRIQFDSEFETKQAVNKEFYNKKAYHQSSQLQIPTFALQKDSVHPFNPQFCNVLYSSCQGSRNESGRNNQLSNSSNLQLNLSNWSRGPDKLENPVLQRNCILVERLNFRYQKFGVQFKPSWARKPHGQFYQVDCKNDQKSFENRAELNF